MVMRFVDLREVLLMRPVQEEGGCAVLDRTSSTGIGHEFEPLLLVVGRAFRKAQKINRDDDDDDGSRERVGSWH